MSRRMHNLLSLIGILGAAALFLFLSMI